ncbi:glycosyl hydrolase family 8 [Ramlibacter sp. PS4R-6]|uniref:glycosyl hydrolase family 8 n=1 Tax=Ramlibacter sp. PS4R-6 TaxID=3133438 RepID=UPI0030983D40
MPAGPAPAPAPAPAPSPDAPARAFPAHASYTAGVIKPSHVTQAAMDQAVQAHYAAWKGAYIRTTGGQGSWVKYDATNSTVSEAHGWGMVIAAYMGDRALFDDMLRYAQAHPSANAPHLMAWKQTLSGGVMKSVEGVDSATDGSMDVAYALLLAHAQWGSAGAYDYKAEALQVTREILAHEVNATAGNLMPGDWAQGSDRVHTRPSDFMTSHLLAFARADTVNAAKWTAVYDTVSAIVNHQYANGSAATGLVPDFMVQSGAAFVPVPGTYLESLHDGDFSYNACRTPWRLAMSHIVDGRTDLLASQRQTATWIAASAKGVPRNIRAGYYVRNGTNGKAFADWDDLAFTAPMAVNAMLGGPSSQEWLNSLWTSITGGDYGPTVDYYGDTIRMQVLLTVSGNWWAP